MAYYMRFFEFFQDRKGTMSAGRFAAVIGGVLAGGAYIFLHPSDANLAAYLTYCVSCFGLSKGFDSFGRKNDNASS